EIIVKATMKRIRENAPKTKQRRITMVICTKCGDKVGTTGWGDRCYGCQLDPLLPQWYQDAEQYVHFQDLAIPSRATAHPKTGLDILDQTPLRLSQIALPIGLNPHRI
ncbi:hypothetical protein LCGC14_1904650, partial [marine sediment metagenome]